MPFLIRTTGLCPSLAWTAGRASSTTTLNSDGMEFAQSDEMVRMPGANSDAPAWIECAMYRKDRTRPVVIREYLDGRYREPFKGKFGLVTGPWQTHPKRFLRHKAMIQCAGWPLDMAASTTRTRPSASSRRTWAPPKSSRPAHLHLLHLPPCPTTRNRPSPTTCRSGRGDPERQADGR